MAVDALVLLACLDCSFTESVSMWMAGGGKAQVDVELSVQLFEEFTRQIADRDLKLYVSVDHIVSRYH